MLFWIFVIIMVVGAVIWWFTKDDCGYGFDMNTFGAILFWIALIAVLISCFIFIDEYGCVDAKIAKNQAIYDSLVWQYENDIYDNDNDLGKRELMVDIQNWNKDLAYYRAVQDNFWLGIYVNNVFDQFDFIELERTAVE